MPPYLKKIFDNVDGELKSEWLIFNPIISGMSTLRDMEEWYNFDDMLRLNAVCDIKTAVKNKSIDEATKAIRK